MNQIISRCGPEDFGDISTLVNAAYRGEAGIHGWTSEVGLVAGPRITIAALAEDIASSPDASILALRQGGEYCCGMLKFKDNLTVRALHD
jgi:hypothetical protein